jgi:AcrR family transcriptional regulator
MVSPGIRERKKQATRRALGEAALRLAVERGIDHVRVEDIAEAADVSPRTFSNYFRTKYDAITALGFDLAGDLGEALRCRPADEPLWPAIRAAVLTRYPDDTALTDRTWVARVRLIMTSEPVQGSRLALTAAMASALADAIAERSGADAKAELWPEAIAWAVVAAAQTALRRWSTADPPVALRPLIEDALDALELLARPEVRP